MSIKDCVDSLPEFKGLVLTSSALMLEAKSHQAKDEPFDAAVAWIKAGRSLSELGARLLEAGYARDAAEDFLNSANCFLEAGDPRPADRELERFDEGGELRAALKESKYLQLEYNSACKRYGICFQSLQKTLDEMREQMGHAQAAHNLRIRWLDKALAAMPGVLELHWFGAQKFYSLSNSSRTDDHLRWYVLLSPERHEGWVMRIHYLLEAGRHLDAVRVSEDAVRHHPDNARVRWISGWALFKNTIVESGPKSLLESARNHLERAISLNQLDEKETVGAVCSVALCLWEQGRHGDARHRLRRVVQNHPVPEGELAWRMLAAKNKRDRSVIMQDVPKLMVPSAA